MNRCKLEYIIHQMDTMDFKKLVELIDPYGDYFFKPTVCKFLRNPETTDDLLLKRIIPGYKYENVVNNYKIECSNRFKRINNLCKKNNICPLFDEPENLPLSEMTREDLVKMVPEEQLNEFFGVKAYYEYEPKVYEPEEPALKQRENDCN